MNVAEAKAAFLARTTDPQESHAFMKSYPWESNSEAILRALKELGPMDYRGVAEATGIYGTSTSTCLSKMQAAGLVEAIPGGRARLWRAV